MIKKCYKNVKCSLRSLLVKQVGKEINAAASIEKRCVSVSKMAVKASHLCRIMVEMLLKEEEEEEEQEEEAEKKEEKVSSTTSPPTEWPDFTKMNVFVQLFTKGNSLRKATKPTPAIDRAWYGRELQLQPRSEGRHHSDYNLVNYCAKTYQTAFLNNLQFNFVSRQRRAIRVYLKCCGGGGGGGDRGGLGEKKRKKSDTTRLVYALQCFINDWKYAGRTYSEEQLRELRIEHFLLVERHKSHLPPVGKNSLQPVDFLRYYNFLKREYKETSTKLKNLPLVPQNEVKVHYVDFDAVGVKGLCHDLGININLADKEKKEKETLHDEVLQREGWGQIFDLKRIRKMGGKGWTFDRCIATDGIACSVRYYRELGEEEEKRKSRQPKKKFKKSNGTAANDLSEPETQQQLHLEGKRIIGIDPGRKNIAFCVELDPESRKIVKKSKLTSKRFYCDSGYVRHKRLTEKWTSEKKYKLAIEEFSACESFDSYLDSNAKNYETVWETKTSKKWRRSKFRVYCLKKKTLDKFVKSVVGDPSKQFHVAFGRAKFAATGRGEHFSSPSSTLRKLFREKFGPENFTLVDEWNTSKVCHRCKEPLTIVGSWRRAEGDAPPLILRGLRLCSSRQRKNNLDEDEGDASAVVSSIGQKNCPIAGSFVDRDSNAATNIASKLLMLPHLLPLSESPSPSQPSNLARGVSVKVNKRKIFWLKMKNKIN